MVTVRVENGQATSESERHQMDKRQRPGHIVHCEKTVSTQQTQRLWMSNSAQPWPLHKKKTCDPDLLKMLYLHSLSLSLFLFLNQPTAGTLGQYF